MNESYFKPCQKKGGKDEKNQKKTFDSQTNRTISSLEKLIDDGKRPSFTESKSDSRAFTFFSRLEARSKNGSFFKNTFGKRCMYLISSSHRYVCFLLRVLFFFFFLSMAPQGQMSFTVYSTADLLRFLRRAKREHQHLFESLDTKDLKLRNADKAELAKIGEECVAGYFYEYTRDALVAAGETIFVLWRLCS